MPTHIFSCYTIYKRGIGSSREVPEKVLKGLNKQLIAFDLVDEKSYPAGAFLGCSGILWKGT